MAAQSGDAGEAAFEEKQLVAAGRIEGDEDAAEGAIGVVIGVLHQRGSHLNPIGGGRRTHGRIPVRAKSLWGDSLRDVEYWLGAVRIAGQAGHSGSGGDGGSR